MIGDWTPEDCIPGFVRLKNDCCPAGPFDFWWLDYLPEDCIPVHVRLEKFAASQDLWTIGGWTPQDCIPVHVRLNFLLPRRTFG